MGSWPGCSLKYVFYFCLLQATSLYLLSHILSRTSTLSKFIMSSELEQPNRMEQVYQTKKRALIIYVYLEKNQMYLNTLSYFLDIGVQESDKIDYLFIIQDFNVSVPLPTHYNNVKVLKRNNTCYDFGAFGIGLEYMGGLKEVGDKYQYFIFINPSAFGPILPKYWPENIHWTEIFLSRFKGSIHAVGASLSCHEFGPVLDGWFIAASHDAVLAANSTGTFACHKNKAESIDNGEYGFSTGVIRAGLNMDCLLLKYPSGIDWTNKTHWKCNGSPMWNDGYTNDNNSFNLNVHPLETVFFKPIWFDQTSNPYEQGGILSSVYLDESLTYMEWAQKRKHAKTPSTNLVVKDLV